MLLHVLHWLYPFFQGIFFGLLAMTLHEGGHVLVALIVGVRVKTVGIRWRGFYTVREAGPPEKNILVSLGGPVANLLLALAWPLSPVFGLSNLCMGFCNLLPVRGSDGDRILDCWRTIQQQKDRGSDGSLPQDRS